MTHPLLSMSNTEWEDALTGIKEKNVFQHI